MDDFENGRVQDKEEKIRNKFIESYTRQLAFIKKLFLAIFGSMGLLFLVLGGVFFALEDSFELAITFLILGIFLVFLAIILFVIFSVVRVTDKTYDRCMRMQNKFGIMNAYAVTTYITTHEEELASLEQRIKTLEEELARLKNKR